MSPPASSPPAEPSPVALRAAEGEVSRLDSSFGAPTDFALPEPLPRASRVGFELCQIGLVLRAVLFVEAALALGILFVATDAAQAMLRLALASAAALPGLLLWLALACLGQDRLGRLDARAQWLVAGLLGALCGWSGWALVDWAGRDMVDLGPGLAALLAGAFMGVLLTVWVQLRSRSRLPADATARLAELQSRIRPHFLFNTLNSALGLVHRDPARAEALLEDLSELFRSALADGASAVSLGDEIELARRYLAIEQTRFGGRLRVQWQLDPAAAAARLPPLLLQPLVENAVRHGIEPNPDGGVIRIRTRVQRGQAWVSITNTLPPSSAAAPVPGHGIALQNVRERLSLMHDLSASFEVKSDADRFQVQMALPI